MARKQCGFTLLELIIASAIMGVLMTYVFSTMVESHRKAEVLDEIVTAQQNSRVIADLLERDLRHAGFLVPEAAALCAIDSRIAPDQLWVSDQQAVVPGTGLATNLGAVIQGAPVNIAAGTQMLAVDTLVLDTPPVPAYDTDGNGIADADFQPGSGVIVADEQNPSRGSACGTVVAVTAPGQLQVTIETNPLGPVPAGGNVPLLKVVPAQKYRVNAAGQLFRGALPVATDVEDLQLALFYDDNTNNLIEANEYRGDGVGPDYVANQVNGANLREVRLNIVLRTRQPDRSNLNGRMQATENRTPVAVADGFRRRVQTATVRLRNVGGRSTL